jgi:hypothetical protein
MIVFHEMGDGSNLPTLALIAEQMEVASGEKYDRQILIVALAQVQEILGGEIRIAYEKKEIDNDQNN